MYNKYRRGCCNNNFNMQVLEDVCDDVGMTAQFNTMPLNDGCCCNNMNMQNCGCGFDEGINVFPSNPMLAQSYVPIQFMDKTFTPCCGLKMGTIFPELVSPYSPGQSMAQIDYLRARNEIGEGCNA